MKKLLAFVLASLMCVGLACPAQAASDDEISDGNISIPVTDANSGESEIQPRVSYDHPISDFTLSAGEQAFTTRWGYGFTISNEGYNHNDIDLSFAVNGAAVNLKIAVLTMESYSNENYDISVKSETITSAGSKKVSFNNLDYGTYVIMWQNIGEKQINISGARLTTSY